MLLCACNFIKFIDKGGAMSQNKKLLHYLKNNGSIDPMQSWRKLGIYRLSARIHDLRAEGHHIKTIEKKDEWTKYIYTS